MAKKKFTIAETDKNYDLLLKSLIELAETSRSEANNAISLSINQTFAENEIAYRVSGDISTNPVTLKILGLKDDFTGKSKKEILLMKVEEFLLNFKMQFAVVYRDKQIQIGDEWFRVDLVLFNRRLKCLVIIDLKLGKLTHADIGQMLLYTGYADKHWREEGENPPVGLILCDQNNESLARYTLENLPNQILAKEYRMVLPDEKVLEEEITRVKRLLGK